MSDTTQKARGNSADSPGEAMYQLACELFPFHRGITGPGVRETLKVLKQHVALQVHEVPSGTAVCDWEVPMEWRVSSAYIADADGHHVVDIGDSNLHIVGYSDPIHATLPWSELRTHLVTLPAYKNWIPFRSSHFESGWGFCLTHHKFEELEARGEVEYQVVIESELIDGTLTYGEIYLPGAVHEEVLISTHVCHPSLANDNLSGIVVATWLAKQLASTSNRYSYRFVFVPATIGAIAWLALNEKNLKSIRHGLVLTGIGDSGSMTYKRSRRDSAEIDRAAINVLEHSTSPYEIRKYEPFGYDERQYCSPGVDLPMGCLMRSPNGEYPEYHTSGDNLDFIRADSLADSLDTTMKILSVLEANISYVNQNPMCEPQLGRRGLYRSFGKLEDGGIAQRAVQWVLNYSDGCHSLLDIAERASLPFDHMRRAANVLIEHQLLREAKVDAGVSK